MLIRRCVYENVSKDDIQKLFPEEVLPELQRLLTLLLQKFQTEWRADVFKDQVMFLGLRFVSGEIRGCWVWILIFPVQVDFPRLKAMTWNMANQDAAEGTDPVAVINLKVLNSLFGALVEY